MKRWNGRRRGSAGLVLAPLRKSARTSEEELGAIGFLFELVLSKGVLGQIVCDETAKMLEREACQGSLYGFVRSCRERVTQ